MSNAEELLNSLSESGIAVYTVDPETEPHIVIDSDRVITVPDELQRLAVQYDHNIETVTFDCPRYWDGLDMSEMTVYINYLRSDKEKGSFIATNVVADDNDPTIMHFDWTISRNVTEAYGQLVFLVCIKKTDDNYNEENHWNSELCKICNVSEGLELDEEVINEIYPDIIEVWHKEVLGIIDEVETVKDNLIDMRDSGEFDGATFTPYVSKACDLSWSNDKGRTNPTTVNIKGDPGISPTVTVTEITGGYRLTITDINKTSHLNILDGTLVTADAVDQVLHNYTYIGETEPASGPALWFDTSEVL